MYDEVEMNTWMASLTGDPGMAALLEPIVAPPQVSSASPITRMQMCMPFTYARVPFQKVEMWLLSYTPVWKGIQQYERDEAQQHVFGTCQCLLPLSVTSSAVTYPDLRSNLCALSGHGWV